MLTISQILRAWRNRSPSRLRVRHYNRLQILDVSLVTGREGVEFNMAKKVAKRKPKRFRVRDGRLINRRYLSV